MTETRKVPPGQEFVITLEQNPTTGYVWEVTYDASQLELLKKEYHRTNDLIGGGGKIEFKFRATKEGEASMEFRLVRPWEGRVIETRNFEIVIREAAN